MIVPQANIIEWRKFANWPTQEQVEQDLVLSRILVEIYNDPLLRNELAFRGGTALHKLFLKSSVCRYSEDIDLVRTSTGPVKKIIDALRLKIDPWLGAPKYIQKDARFTLYYRFISNSPLQTKMRVKIEINTRECSAFLPIKHKTFVVDNAWFGGKSKITTFHLEELLGTKLRALFQRKKGRDLYDLALALEHNQLDRELVIKSFYYYTKQQKIRISRAEFEKNLYQKLQDQNFLKDLAPLLNQSSVFPAKFSIVLASEYTNLKKAAQIVHERLIKKLDGNAWKKIEKLNSLLED